MARKPPQKKSAPRRAASKTTAKAPAKPVKFTEKDLIDAVSAQLPLVARATISRIVPAVFEQMTSAYVDGKVVTVKDFGKLQIQHRAARMGRNPATGEEVSIPAKTVPKFTFAKALKDAAA